MGNQAFMENILFKVNSNSRLILSVNDINLLLFYEKMMNKIDFSQLTFTCSKLTIETVEQGVKYVQS